MTRRPRPQVFGYCFKRKFFIRFEKKKYVSTRSASNRYRPSTIQVCRGILVFHRMKYKRFSSNQVFHQVNKLIRNGFWKSSS